VHYEIYVFLEVNVFLQIYYNYYRRKRLFREGRSQ